MNKYSLLIALTLVLSGMAVSGFQEAPLNPALEKDPQVLAALELRLMEYRRARAERCQEEVWERADEIVDSLLISITKEAMREMLKKPPRPNRPGFPDILKPKDTLLVRPLWEIDTLKADSLSPDFGPQE